MSSRFVMIRVPTVTNLSARGIAAPEEKPDFSDSCRQAAQKLNEKFEPTLKVDE